MRIRLKTLLTIVALLAAEAMCLPFNVNELAFVDSTWKDGRIRHYSDRFGEYKPDNDQGECGHWAMRALCNGSPRLFHLLKRWGKLEPKCNVGGATYNDGLPQFHRALPYLQKHGFMLRQGTMTYGPGRPNYNNIKQWFGGEDPMPGDVIVIVECPR
jgi:hypothetical protein